MEIDFIAALTLISVGEDLHPEIYNVENLLPDKIDNEALEEEKSQFVEKVSKFIILELAQGKTTDINDRKPVDELKKMQREDGMFCDDFSANLYACLALETAKAEYNKNKYIDSLLLMQTPDGVFVEGDESISNTGLAMTVLSLFDKEPYKNAIGMAEAYIKNNQSDSGNFIVEDKESIEALAFSIAGLTDNSLAYKGSSCIDMEITLLAHKDDMGTYFIEETDYTAYAFYAYESINKGISPLKKLAKDHTLSVKEQKAIPYDIYIGIGAVLIVSLLTFLAVYKDRKKYKRTEGNGSNNKSKFIS